MEKRSKEKLGPLGGNHLIIFIDDFNIMPKKTSFESPFQPVMLANEIKQFSFNIASATLHVYKAVSADFLATPETFHYLL